MIGASRAVRGGIHHHRVVPMVMVAVVVMMLLVRRVVIAGAFAARARGIGTTAATVVGRQQNSISSIRCPKPALL